VSRRKLTEQFEPNVLDIKDESHKHAGHSEVPDRAGGETHFRVKIVSQLFEGKTMVQRHRMIYSVLEDEFQAGVHALALQTKTPAESGQ